MTVGAAIVMKKEQPAEWESSVLGRGTEGFYVDLMKLGEIRNLNNNVITISEADSDDYQGNRFVGVHASHVRMSISRSTLLHSTDKV